MKDCMYVIPAQAGILNLQDSRFRGNDRGGFIVTQRMLSMFQKKEKKQ